MRYDTPLRNRHEAIAAAAGTRRPVPGADRPGAALPQFPGRPHHAPPRVAWLPYGPPDADGATMCDLVATYGSVESEYAAIRRGVGLLDAPHRATLRATGSDRIAFLNRMVTQELKDLANGQCRASFWLNRKGRIDADLLVCAEPGDGGALLIDVDVHQAASALTSLTSYVFAEDIALIDDTASRHRICVHGPESIVLLRRASTSPTWSIAPGAVDQVTIADSNVIVARRDDTGEVGLHLFVPRDAVERVWDALAADDVDAPSAGGRPRLVARPIGWHAYNIARIEAGTPLMNVDFDTSCLPHETGVLRDRVSFTKGCYLGQEVVARMQSLGKPKQTLVGLRIEGDALPEAGGLVHVRAPAVGVAGSAERDAVPSQAPVAGAAPADAFALGEPVGTITSSTISPMLGAAPVAFAMVKTAHAESGRRLFVVGDGVRAEAVVGSLRFWTQPGTGAPP